MRRRGVVGPADAAEEQADHLVADELVDQSVVVEHDVGRDPIETVQEGLEFARRQSLADAVEPRMSANSKVIGISAPVTPDLRNSVTQLVHIAGLPAKRPKPT